MKKQCICLLIVLVMLIGMLPMTALAADTTEAAQTVVYMTVSNKGVLAKDKDGGAMAVRKVTVTDTNNDGKLTYHEALLAAHAAYSSPDAYVATQTSYGMTVSKLWGVETGNCLFYVNNTALSVNVGEATVSAGDYLVVSVNQDDTYYSDHYTYFNANSKYAVAGEEVTLALRGSLSTGDKLLSDVSIGTWSNGAFTALTGKTTGTDGMVKVSFDKPGTYYVTATGTVNDTISDYTAVPDASWVYPTINHDCPIIAPVCVVTVVEKSYTGTGSAEDPYVLSTAEDMGLLSTRVAEGESFEGKYFKLKNDITMPENWQALGAVKPEKVLPAAIGTNVNSYVNPFSGTLDGDGHTLTFVYGSQPLVSFARTATLQNFNILAPYIPDEGLVANYRVEKYNTPIVTVSNVTIKSGSNIKNSGFIGGYASGSNTITITDCTVESGVKIGWDADLGTSASNDYVGSFGGEFNGTITNSSSAATVYGGSYVGGILASKGQSMGACTATACQFTGKIIASGSYVGGIVGAGYNGGGTAPNTPAVSIENCLVSGNISGADKVGGVLGGEIGCVQAWVNGIGYIRNNLFTGTVAATAENAYVGSMIGYMNGMDKYNVIENNYYSANCGTTSVIGGAKYIDTSCTTHETASTAIYYDTSAGGTFGSQGWNKTYTDPSTGATIVGPAKENHNRTDDPLGADADKLAQAVSAKELTDGTVTALLNSGDGTQQNWLQGTAGPVQYTAADEKAAAAVDEMIAAIGTTLTAASAKNIEAARDAYNALTEPQRLLVKKIQTLTDAEAALATADKAAADAVTAKIKAIGDKITLSSEEAIKAARAAYDALTDRQKALVTNADVLSAAEGALNDLKSDLESPKTGDETEPVLIIGIMVISLCGVVALVTFPKKKQF